MAHSDPLATPIILLHGFTQTSTCWGPFGDALAGTHPVVALDAPGHGRRPDVPGDLWGAATAMADAAGTRGVWIGYSMGGRIALHVALARPELVDALVVISATPGIEDEAARADRRRRDEELARHLERIGVDDFVTEWTAQPMFAAVPDEHRFVAARRSNTTAGLAASLRRCGTGAQAPLWDRLAELRMPVLALAGSDDPPYVRIAERIAATIGRTGRSAVVEGAGHAVHLEAPSAAVDAVRAVLEHADARR